MSDILFRISIGDRATRRQSESLTRIKRPAAVKCVFGRPTADCRGRPSRDKRRNRIDDGSKDFKEFASGFWIICLMAIMTRIKNIAFRTHDVEKTAEFYKSAFGLEQVALGKFGIYLTDAYCNI